MTDRHGIDATYEDASGATVRITAAARRRLAEIIGEPPAGDAPVIVVRPEACAALGNGALLLEDGGEIPLGEGARATLPLGYHRQIRSDGGERLVIVAPERAHLPAGWRAWGWAVQLYASRSARSWGIGDFDDLGRLGRFGASQGAGYLLVNPLGAIAPSGPPQASPYFPASRRFRNPLYLAVGAVPGADRAESEISRCASAATALNEQRVIDRPAVWREKRAALEAIWRAAPASAEFERWRARQPESLEAFAAWCTLCDRHGPRWTSWPPRWRRPDKRALAAFAAENADAVGFHSWLQWLCDQQFASAAEATAVIEDLPIGVDPEGFDAWTWQHVLALDASVGAPPDEFNRLGQNWGLPPFVPWRLRAEGYGPFIATIRAALRGGGGLRIDHVMGLFRLWWIPRGDEASAGAYVRYPADDLLGIVALESVRAGAVVVGEDLGTVEKRARQMLARRGVLSYRLLWFEEAPPRRWPRAAMAAVTTHDLPTVAGLWSGSDLAVQEKLGLQPNVEGTLAIRERLRRRGRLAPGACDEEAVVAAYRLLARAPCTLLGATLDDAVVERERPNVPGADEKRPNWSLALPCTIEEIEEHPVARAVAAALGAAVGAEPGVTPAVSNDDQTTKEHDDG